MRQCTDIETTRPRYMSDPSPLRTLSKGHTLQRAGGRETLNKRTGTPSTQCAESLSHIRLPPVGSVRIRRPFAQGSLFCDLRFSYRRFLAADGQNALGTKVSQKPKYSSSFLPCQSLLLTLRALRVTQIIGRSTLQALEDLPSCEERCCCTGGGVSLSDVDRDGTLAPLRGARRSNPPVR